MRSINFTGVERPLSNTLIAKVLEELTKALPGCGSRDIASIVIRYQMIPPEPFVCEGPAAPVFLHTMSGEFILDSAQRIEPIKFQIADVVPPDLNNPRWRQYGFT